MIEKIATENGIECDFVPQSAYVYTMQDKYIDKIKDEAVIAEFLGIKPHTLKKYLCPSQLKPRSALTTRPSSIPKISAAPSRGNC